MIGYTSFEEPEPELERPQVSAALGSDELRQATPLMMAGNEVEMEPDSSSEDGFATAEEEEPEPESAVEEWLNDAARASARSSANPPVAGTGSGAGRAVRNAEAPKRFDNSGNDVPCWCHQPPPTPDNSKNNIMSR